MNLKQTRGFTLIELLVVVAAVGILLSILVPAVTKGVKLAQRAQASAGMRSIVQAWQQYSYDNDGKIPSSNNYAINQQPPWVLKPQGTTVEAREDAIEQGALYPYLTNFDVFTDPNHAFPSYINSYAINGFLNGEWARNAGQLGPTGSGVTHIDQANPGTVMLLPEYDARNYNINSFIMDPVSCNWIDRVAGNYWGGDNLAFVDGHVEFRNWESPRTLENLGQHGLRDPGSVDCEYLETVFFPR